MYNRLDFIQRANAGYIEEQYRRYRLNPESVPEEWALFFAGFDLAEDPSRRPGIEAGPSGVYGLVHTYREFGHLIAQLNPLGGDLTDHPLLDLAQFGLDEQHLDQPVDPRPFLGLSQGTLRDLIKALRETYCGTLGVEYVDIPDKERREWLQARMEPTRNHPALGADDRQRILRSMLAADAFEQFLHVKYVGQKRFSLEGGATLIPMLDMLVETASSMGVEYLALGMAHRGRLNVLAHIVGKPLERIFSEFESDFAPVDVMGHGDVKYHLGFSGQVATRGGRPLLLDLHYNPSHLEFVNPVLLGAIRARQDAMKDTARERGVPVLIHGDASMAGEGIVPETLTMSQLGPYDTGGTIHIVINNQIGFTTTPWHARVTRYCTDIARVIEAPVLHVNGDDPEAAVHAIALAVEYRARFKRDVLVDMICYRKYGHNELDDPTFTQPAMYQKIAAHTPASRAYARRLIESGVIDESSLKAMEREIEKSLQEAHQRVRNAPPATPRERLGGLWKGLDWAGEDWSAVTAAPRQTLERIVAGLNAMPKDFEPHSKNARLNAERQEMLRADRIDWGLGEALALGSLVLEGRHVRISGQDTGRGTFSHRHAILRDHRDGHRYIPLQHLAPEQGRFAIFDTPLNEAACLGFEYGYSAADPHTLVIWEAQFGDFANVAQVYIDQFVASAESKWRRMSGIVLLLPHGYEGQGPEHSSARLERFLELCANGNMQVVNLTTPAQLFHALRRQVLRNFRKPLVVMSPKSLLRHKRAVSAVADFVDGAFHTVLDDGLPDPRSARRVLLCSGKFFYTLFEARAERSVDDAALVRIEQLYPFPRAELIEILGRYPNARDVRWVQEEPANMGAWRGIRHRLEGVLPNGATLSLVARKASPTPATGFYALHAEEEKELLDRALAEVGALPTRVARDTSRRR
ncbi:MAG TPA: 2-oxoglutarate dehydrogenase E1 component [Candidatus Eisenbacteria bacterium]|nr:2-oxoglutarate dehydrogenase E1 component [Candidatus Eisenbacteria bacterium]